MLNSSRKKKKQTFFSDKTSNIATHTKKLLPYIFGGQPLASLPTLCHELKIKALILTDSASVGNEGQKLQPQPGRIPPQCGILCCQQNRATASALSIRSL